MVSNGCKEFALCEQLKLALTDSLESFQANLVLNDDQTYLIMTG